MRICIVDFDSRKYQQINQRHLSIATHALRLVSQLEITRNKNESALRLE